MQNALGANNQGGNFVLDPEQTAQLVASDQFREIMNKQLIQQLAEKRRKERMMAWGLGLGAAALLGVGGWFVYTRYIQE